MPSSPSERVVFEVSFRSVYDWVPETKRPELAKAWRALGIDVSRMLPGYPVETWWAAVEAVTTMLEGTRRERLRQIGRGLAEQYSQTFMGRALLPLARLIGTRRSLLRSPINFRAGNNFVDVVIELDEPQHMKLRVNDVSPISEMFAGSIEGLVLVTGGRTPSIEFEEVAEHTVYTVRWSAPA